MPVSTISSSQSHRRNCSSQTTSPMPSVRKNKKVSDSFFLNWSVITTIRNNVHFSKLRSVFYRFWNSVSAQKFLYRTRLPENSSPPWISWRKCLILSGHITEEITLKELADIACMSPTYFCRYFHQEMGKTPFAFLNEYRIKKAAILLDDSSLSVSDIAINCGFDNISYFIRKFKEYQGITPKKYRSRKMPE